MKEALKLRGMISIVKIYGVTLKYYEIRTTDPEDEDPYPLPR